MHAFFKPVYHLDQGIYTDIDSLKILFFSKRKFLIEAEKMYEAGADYVVVPEHVSAEKIIKEISKVLK